MSDIAIFDFDGGLVAFACIAPLVTLATLALLFRARRGDD